MYYIHYTCTHPVRLAPFVDDAVFFYSVYFRLYLISGVDMGVGSMSRS